MNFERKERFYKNKIIQRDKEENEKFKNAINFQNNIFTIQNELKKNKEFFKLQQEIKNCKKIIEVLKNENNYLKNKISSYENKLQKCIYEMQLKKKRINHLICENDDINNIYKDMYISEHIWKNKT
ncbi:conserved Plasmodium protein, unknown function [Plasmodium ovale]|uniref:Uncharacterized protein n=1 Tax=Plasmodium ovale TaxID=36330 RepID=A0A1C3KUJ4_PLAOA|nr:conserved Plasmodium protein, unknown function [Plasmodium ovale]